MGRACRLWPRRYCGLTGKFGTQRERVQRLKEHAEQILAEMRASKAEVQ
jgi:glycyl-tRNA synthetase beta subunit